MLTEAEKTHIELQERYRAEIAKQFAPKSKKNILETATKVLQALAIIIGIWATYNEFKKYNEENQKYNAEKQKETEREARQAAKDFSKHIQFDRYAEAVDAASILATEARNSPDYMSARKNFYRLYWGKLALVEDNRMERRMVQFERLLRSYEDKEKKEDSLWDDSSQHWIILKETGQSDLRQAALRLAQDAKRYVLDTWLDSLSMKNYR